LSCVNFGCSLAFVRPCCLCVLVLMSDVALLLFKAVLFVCPVSMSAVAVHVYIPVSVIIALILMKAAAVRAETVDRKHRRHGCS
jgi:uncharacterized membrane protein